MTIRITTTRSAVAMVLALAYVGLSPAHPAAADREHQQLMADLRMLQEQTQQLQALMNDLGEALRAVSSRIDEQTSLERKAFADGKVQMDSMSGDIRVVREKVDETNVRLGDDHAGDRIDPPGDSRARSDAAGAREHRRNGRRHSRDRSNNRRDAAAGRRSRRSASASVRRRMGRLHRRQLLARDPGFRHYLRSFPKSTRAHEAQLYIGEALAWEKKDMEAVVVYDRVISSYPGSGSIPMAYYKRGRALENLGENARARESYETLIKQFPDAAETGLAKQRIDRLK